MKQFQKSKIKKYKTYDFLENLLDNDEVLLYNKISIILTEVNMGITIKEIEHLAKLARLNLSDEEKSRLSGEMSGILDFAQKLSELDVSNISPTMHVGTSSNVFREDVAKPSYPTAEILKNAAEADESCFLVPKTVE